MPLELDQDGNVIVCPLTGYETLIYREMLLILILEYSDPRGEAGPQSRSLQIGVSPPQAQAIFITS
jgi:hypothetical protein